ncbi:MAG: family 43 glycosylhydrolase [Terracidiphilus sp.]|jgi:xylan 1,4-beta-xylosidase
MNSNRREVFKTLLAGSLLVPEAVRASTIGNGSERTNEHKWALGIEGQRKADLGNGTFLNPIIAGDHPDPTILKDGEDYYMTFSSFYACPGAVIWHSRDLVNWAPIGPALTKPIGSVWAMDLVKHHGRYFIYIPASPNDRQTVFVVWADNIKGPWSDPIDLNLPGCIDPGHAVGEDGKRYLFVNGIRRIRLTDDGLATDGKLEHAYDPWKYPKDWVVEMFSAEGPKLLKHGQWFYLISAVGGTAGPPTSHMVIAARSRSILGPWEQCPHNPLVRTQSAIEKWWSRGHASLVEGPGGDWWMVYHGYENGFRTLGRQTLLEPIEWTADGWFRAKGGDLSLPLPMPAKGNGGPSGFALSDDFTVNKFGVQWSFHNPERDEMNRVRFEHGSLTIAGKGDSPINCSPLTCIVGDLGYEATVTFDTLDKGEGGLLLYYSERMFVGVGFTPTQMLTFNYGKEQSWMRTEMPTSNVMIKVRNDRNIVTFSYSHNGKTWIKHPWQMEVSGMHHNVLGDFLSLRPGIYSSGPGSIRITNFRYNAL